MLFYDLWPNDTHTVGGFDLFEFFDEHPDGVPEKWAKQIMICILKGRVYCAYYYTHTIIHYTHYTHYTYYTNYTTLYTLYTL